MRRLSCLVALLAGCGPSNPDPGALLDGGRDDRGAPEDLAVPGSAGDGTIPGADGPLADLPPAPDWARWEDLVGPGDRGVPGDLGTPGDLFPPADGAAAADLSPASELAVPLDLAEARELGPPDLVTPDLAPLSDLAAPRDFALPVDFTPPPDFALPADFARPPDLTAPDLAAAASVVFTVLGDIPYAPGEEAILRQQVKAIPPNHAFAFHIGDIKTGAAPCDEIVYQSVSGILAQSVKPLFVMVGDNEWNDCANPAAAWLLWNKYFLHFERRFAPLPFVVENPVARPEEVGFVHLGVLFLNLTLVGGTVHDAAEWKQRHADSLAFTKAQIQKHGPAVRAVVILAQAIPAAVHNDYFNGLVAEATQFRKPMIYLHGDAHVFYCKRPWTAKNLVDVQIDPSGVAPPLAVTVTTDPSDPFLLDRTSQLVHSRDCK